MPNSVLALFIGMCFCPLLSVLGFDANKLTNTTICVLTHCVLLVLCPSLLYQPQPPTQSAAVEVLFIYSTAHSHGASAV